MLGAEQLDWLFEDMANTKARWNVLAQQTAFAPFNDALTSPPAYTGIGDNWEGYVAERQRIIDWAVEHETPNFVVLTGDSHKNWVRNIPPHYSSLEGAMGTEFLGTSVSSGSDPAQSITEYSLANNPQLLLRNNNHGYCKCTLTPDTWTSEFRVVSTVRQKQATVSSLATFVVDNGVPGARRVAP